MLRQRQTTVLFPSPSIHHSYYCCPALLRLLLMIRLMYEWALSMVLDDSPPPLPPLTPSLPIFQLIREIYVTYNIRRKTKVANYVTHKIISSMPVRSIKISYVYIYCHMHSKKKNKSKKQKHGCLYNEIPTLPSTQSTSNKTKK